MKKFLSLIVLIITFSTIFAFNTKAQSLSGKMFQCQYVPGMTKSIIFAFYKNGNFELGIRDLFTGETKNSSGTWTVRENRLYLNTGGNYDKNSYFVLSWITGSTFIFKASDVTQRYAICGSPEDTFMVDIMNANTSNYNNYPNPNYYQQPNNVYVPSKKTCPACGGSGWYSRYGQSGKCSGCGGTGWIIN